MISRLILIAKNRDFPRIGTRPLGSLGGSGGSRAGSSAYAELPTQSRQAAGVRSISGTDASTQSHTP